MVESCPEDSSGSCCGPHVFTSVLLGILSCVLMTGGVFLAFHRWDPLWLIVSGIGVILVLIGSILHCCRAKQPPVGKGCCLPDHLHNHVLLNGGSLTEQLLPLSNARSVSQLSLNMLPGYFPPVVATYGIEQHSAVVQNINRIIQQQTQQSPVTPGNPGKSFILLSLPGNTPQANIQNLVATVYQLDGSVLAETSTTSDIPIPTTSVATTVTSVPNCNPILKNAQVQTCTVWSMPNSSTSMMPSSSNVQTSVIMSTQTEDIQPLIAINLMDCSSEPICDNTTSTQTDLSPSTPLVNVSVNTTSNVITNTEQNSPSLIDIAEPPIDSLLEISSAPTTALNIPNTSSDVLIDISENMIEQEIISNNVREISTESAPSSSLSISTTNQSSNSDNEAVLTETASNSETEITSINLNVQTALSSSLAVPSTSTAHEASESVSQDNSENNSLCVIDIDDSDSLDRSSPPPSYEDVALQSETPVGVFGLAYGTL